MTTVSHLQLWKCPLIACNYCGINKQTQCNEFQKAKFEVITKALTDLKDLPNFTELIKKQLEIFPALVVLNDVKEQKKSDIITVEVKKEEVKKEEAKKEEAKKDEKKVEVKKEEAKKDEKKVEVKQEDSADLKDSIELTNVIISRCVEKLLKQKDEAFNTILAQLNDTISNKNKALVEKDRIIEKIERERGEEIDKLKRENKELTKKLETVKNFLN
jgi:hypothetical protein